jgi:hypothetical protein
MLKKLILGLLALLAGLLGAAALQPSEMHVTRSTTIAAPNAEVFALVNDLHRWNAWSPWAKMDPKAQNHFEGSPTGTGAKFYWASDNAEVGVGSMTITNSQPNQQVTMDVALEKPFKGTNQSTFTFAPGADANHTIVTWAMTGHKHFICKLIGLFMSGEKMVGDTFEDGLANLKTVAEAKQATNRP